MKLNEPGGPWLMAIEVKGPKTPIRDTQVAWSEKWTACGLPYYVMRRPSDLIPAFQEVGFTHSPMVFRGDPTSENEAQRAIKEVLRMHGWTCTDTSQGFRPGKAQHGTTRITLGAPDLIVYHPALRVR